MFVVAGCSGPLPNAVPLPLARSSPPVSHHLLHLPEIQSGMENPHPQPIYTSCLTSPCWTKPFCFALICSTIGVAASLCRSLFCTEQKVCKSCFSLTYSMIPKREQRDWRELARRAANEQDPKKLLEIIEELNAVLEEREKEIRGRIAKPAVPTVSAQQALDKRLLFVDDEPNIRLTLPPLIEQYGFKVKSAGTVAEALGLIKSSNFDVLLCDINISQEGDGFTVVRAMRDANPDCVTVLLTGYPGFETALKAIHTEVDDDVVKPADLGLLVSP